MVVAILRRIRERHDVALPWRLCWWGRHQGLAPPGNAERRSMVAAPAVLMKGQIFWRPEARQAGVFVVAVCVVGWDGEAYPHQVEPKTRYHVGRNVWVGERRFDDHGGQPRLMQHDACPCSRGFDDGLVVTAPDDGES